VRREKRTPFCQEKDYATRIPFSFRSQSLRRDYQLSDDQVHRVAASIFGDAALESSSQQFAYTRPAPC